MYLKKKIKNNCLSMQRFFLILFIFYIYSLREKFINSCLFLINKSDTLSDKNMQRKKCDEKNTKKYN